MRVSVRCVVRAALLSALFSLALLVLLAVMANGLGAAGVGVGTIQVVGFIVGLLARTYAAVVGARIAGREDYRRSETVLSAVLGLAAGYVALQVLNSFVEVVVLARPLGFDLSLLYGIAPWLLAGVLGGLLATRRRKGRSTQSG